MSITAEQRKEAVGTYRVHAKDSGSPDVQIALLTTRINVNLAQLPGYLLNLAHTDRERRLALRAFRARHRHAGEAHSTFPVRAYLALLFTACSPIQ